MSRFDQPQECFWTLSDRQIKHNMESSSFVVSLAAQMAEWQRENMRPANVQSCIMRKRMCGGYGQFPNDYLEELLSPNKCEDIVPGDRLKMLSRLSLDYIIPLVDSNNDDSFLHRIHVEAYNEENTNITTMS